MQYDNYFISFFQYLYLTFLKGIGINMKIQSISKQDLIKLLKQFDDVEDKERILRIVYEEFRREYSSDV